MGFTAIFGGTFNPPHIGHFEMLKALQDNAGIDKILVMPTHIPPHKKCDFLASDSDRAAMCQALTEGFGKAELCLIETERNGKSYTYDTVAALKQKYPEKEFAFVCGADMLVSFDKWYRYKELMKMLPFIVFRRTDTDNTLLNGKIKYFSEMGMKIILMDEYISGVASSYIRKNTNHLSDCVPETVYKYIKAKGLYGAENE